jgi:hypothetical protein
MIISSSSSLPSLPPSSLPSLPPPSLLRNILKSISSIIAISTTLVEVYTRIPQQLLFNSSPDPLNINTINNYDSITIIFPGANGPDKNTDNLLYNIKKNVNSQRNYVVVYDWKKWRGNVLRASYDSINVGKIIGNDIVNSCNSIKHAHLIGISVGAFAADTASKIIKQKSKQGTYVKVTLLDPFCSLGLFNINYGKNNFGRDIDYSEQYLNTDDPVPFTNEPLPNCICYDITNTKDRNIFKPLPNDNMHSWPVYYYSKNFKKLKKKGNNHDIFQRGHVCKVP